MWDLVRIIVHSQEQHCHQEPSAMISVVEKVTGNNPPKQERRLSIDTLLPLHLLDNCIKTIERPPQPHRRGMTPSHSQASLMSTKKIISTRIPDHSNHRHRVDQPSCKPLFSQALLSGTINQTLLGTILITVSTHQNTKDNFVLLRGIIQGKRIVNRPSKMSELRVSKQPNQST